jgi:NAD(P)-dependent dehydrogenase (short-subunit alcohol dehydrogenase family)
MSVVVVTGCSSGFGLETALAFGRRGDLVYATMRDIGRGDALPKQALSEELDIEVLALDVTKDDSVTSTIKAIEATHGTIDVLVNNAGITHLGAIETVDLSKAREVFETNYWGTVRMIQAALPAMRAKGSGVIVNVASIAGRISPPPCSSWYAASKHAVCVLSEALAMELHDTGVRVVSLEPDFYKTEIGTKASSTSVPAGFYASDEAWIADFYVKGVSGGGNPSEVASAIVNAVADPTTPLHVVLPLGSNARILAGQAGSFEQTLSARLDGLEGLAGPRPSR